MRCETFETYEGSIVISEWRGIPVTISEVTAKLTTEQPDFVVTSTHDGEQWDIGAGWRRTSAKGKPYVSLKLDAPALKTPIDCALIRQPVGDYNLVWSRDFRGNAHPAS